MPTYCPALPATVLAAVAVLALGLTPGRAADPPSAAAGASLTVDEVFDRVNGRFDSLQDFECLADTECRDGKKREVRSFRLWYKKPGMLRVHVLRGRSRGSDVVVSSAGEIRGRKGGILKPIVLRLKPEDSRVCNLRGIPVTEFCWSTFYRRFQERAARPGAKLALMPRRDHDAPVEVLLSSTDRGTSTRELLRFDPKLWLLQEKEVFEGETRVDYAAFRAFKTDAGLKDRWFRL